MLTAHSRRFAVRARLAGRNRLALAAARALEQAGGLLVHPVVVVSICALLTADVTDMVAPAVAATAGWIAGYAAAPLVLGRSRRTLPWTLGAAIVRAASLGLLAYVLAGDDVDRDQRLRSILICLAAFGVAAGLARGATEALVPRVMDARRGRKADRLTTLLGSALAVAVGVGGFTLLLDVPRSPLPRLATLFGVAAALAGAAVLALARVAEPAVVVSASRRPPTAPGARGGPLVALGWMTVASLLGALELLLLVGLYREMAFPRAYVLSGIGAFLAATAAASVLADWLLPAGRVRVAMQLSALLSGVAFALAVGLPTLIDLDQAPDTLLGRRPAEAGVWAAMALVGIAQHARRRILPDLAGRTGTSPTPINAAGFVLAFLPLLVATIVQDVDARRWPVAGLAVAIVGIGVAGLVSPRTAVRRVARPTLAAAGTASTLAPLGGRSGR